MAKNKKSSKKEIISAYMKQVLEKGRVPKSVYAFYLETGILEEDFYMHFGSFKAVQKEIYLEFFHHTIDLLSKNDEYETYDARTKLLSFHYTFFELLKANRSYVLLSLKSFKDFPQLSLLRKNFKGYINTLDMNHKAHLHEMGFFADGGSRTHTPVKELRPERSASANSATSAT